ncbi:pyridoxamine 5'-phosphate oxidase family protein [Actinoplanes sp. NEAU-A12]|uniref:Pyridoxamine 5'-phosphate oxidase family protein n=1 Tax=Actinoplanes sandaracinus TaxID=3045177 RepID=A0ABT6WPP1_9ACTN|nr:pyridoxamine 5'-phosphate oxidase family protein [Actinoplanes sandaracinus]MDI6101677.1 pyridoxamine 5'-phosphate oxidase family protein [Actinoplanes sandaracinus]
MPHPGEEELQSRAGLSRQAWGSAGVGATIPPVAAEFLAEQRFLVIAATDDAGAAWVSPLSGRPGFTHARDERTVVVGRLPATGDPLAGRFGAERDIGMIAIEPARRRRMRVNGRARRDGDHLVIHTEQVYSNCPKYIQTRTPSEGPPHQRGAVTVTRELTAAQQRWIVAADTFFIGTYAAGLGIDASHRGGRPGFVTVTGDDRIVWPEYVGNSMFMTMGNLLLEPRCGLLFLDWTRGHTLHLTGRARLDEDPERVAAVPGAQRLVDFRVDRVVEVAGGLPDRWAFGEFFRHNPPVLSA